MKLIWQGDSNIVELTGQKSWSGREGMAFRSLSFPLYNYEGVLIPDRFDQINLVDDDGNDLFTGMVYGVSGDETEMLNITCRDYVWYLTKNTESATFEDKSVDQIFRKLCGMFNINYDRVDSGSYDIPFYKAENKTLFQMLKDCIMMEYNYSGRKLRIIQEKNGDISLVDEGSRKRDIVVDENIISKYKWNLDLNNFANQVKLVGTTEVVSSDIGSREGVIQHFQRVNDVPGPDLRRMSRQILKQKKSAPFVFSASGIDYDYFNFRTGDIVEVNIGDIKGDFEVISDNHKILNNLHNFTIKLRGV